MEPWSYQLAGRFEEHAYESDMLKGNPLRDPHVRPLWVYLPPGYDDDPERRYPSIYVIQGLTGQLDMWRNRSAFRKNFPELVDEQFAGGHCELCYLPDFRRSVRALRNDYDGSFEKFWADFRTRPPFSKDSDGTLLNDWCMAACYSADDDGTVQLPYDSATGELRPEVWQRWLE